MDDSGKIVDAKFKTFGCGSAIASSSLASEWVKGKHLEEAAGIKNSEIAKVVIKILMNLFYSYVFFRSSHFLLSSFIVQCLLKMLSKLL